MFRSAPSSKFDHEESEGRNKQSPVLTPGYSINPLPPLMIFVLGMILAGHHQESMEATMMHKWVGNFLGTAAAARSVTYFLVFISPPTSIAPTRLPSEIVTGFCLSAGGIMLMASVSSFFLHLR